MRPLNPLHEQKRMELQAQMAEFERRGGHVKHCTSADNRNHSGMPITPSMSQRNRSSGGKPMEIKRKKKYPWHETEVGQSFFVEGKYTTDMCSQAAEMNRRHGYVYRCRNEANGCTVMRVK